MGIQNGIGWGIIVIIVSLLCLGIYFAVIIEKYYKSLLRDYINSEEILDESGKNIRNFKSNELKEIIMAFRKSAQIGTDNINTEVIIQKNLSANILKKEEWIKALPSFAIALGLLGTFLGLTMAIFDTNSALENIGDIGQFTKNMQQPISSMSSAFWTSITGVIASLILNSLNVKIKNAKESFYDHLEDYLDNEIYAYNAKNFNAQFKEFNETIKESMLALTRDMRDLFEDGVKELVNKINSNSLDLSKSAEGLKNYTKDLQRLVSNLSKTISNFSEPVDKFKTSISDFVVVSDDLSDNFNRSLGQFIEKVDGLENKFNNLSLSIDKNRDVVKDIGDFIQRESLSLQQSYTTLLSGLDEIKKSNDSQNKEFITQIDKLNKGYSNFESGLGQFMDTLKSLKEDISGGISTTLQSQMNSLSNGVVEGLNGTLTGIKEATEELAKNSTTIGELVKATNEWVAVSKTTDKELGSEIDHESEN